MTDKSPIFSRNTWLYYILYWTALAAVQFLLLVSAFRLPLINALTDSLVSVSVFALIGVGLWFMIKYSGRPIKGLWKNVVFYLAGCFFAVLIWQSITFALLQWIFQGQPGYLAFLADSLVVRLFTGALIYFLLISIDYLLLNIEEMKEKSEHEAELAAMLREAELSVLRSQIRPHFLFNSLNSVSALTLTNPEAAQRMIIKLSEFMRHSLSLGADAMSTLSDELYHVGLYLDIEKVRFAERMVVTKTLDEACGSMLIPSMILQPVIENAVKHGVNTMTTQCSIQLAVACAEGMLNITVTNDFDPDALPPKGTGTGLQNVKQRLSSVYGRSDLLAVSSENNKFTVQLLIPSGSRTEENQNS